jgi:hypothetical protein
MTITDAAAVMSPPIPRRELARRLRDVQPVGTQWGGQGRRPRTYPVAAILEAHAAWCRENVRHLQDLERACQNPDGQTYVRGRA